MPTKTLQIPSCFNLVWPAMRLEIWSYFTGNDSISPTSCSNSLKLFLHERMLQIVHLPGVLMKSLDEVCLFMLRVQEENRPV